MAIKVQTNKTQEELILEKVAKAVDKVGKHQVNKQKRISKILENLKELDLLFSYDNKIANPEGTSYTPNKGWAKDLFQIKQEEDYKKAFKLVTEIIENLKGEPLKLEIYKASKDEKGNTISMSKIQATESQLDESHFSITAGEKEANKKELHYMLAEVKKLQENIEKELSVSKSFLLHYQKFEKMAKTFQYKKSKPSEKDNETKDVNGDNFNAGHIIEAYIRHTSYKEYHTRDNKDEYVNDKLHVAIMLWLSINNAAWWTGGDVGNVQIKGDNPRLATIYSIQQLSSLFLTMYRTPETFNTANLKEILRPEQQKELTDYATIAAKGLENIWDEANGVFIRKEKGKKGKITVEAQIL